MGRRGEEMGGCFVACLLMNLSLVGCIAPDERGWGWGRINSSVSSVTIVPSSFD